MASIDPLFRSLLSKKGSDLHISVGQPPMARVRGELAPMRDEPASAKEVAGWLFDILSAEQRKRFEDELDLDFAHAFGKDPSAPEARFRASYLHKTTGMGAVFRVIPTKIATLDDLGTPPVIRTVSDSRAGLCLVTGPTGSGKSTTLAAMIRHINETRACHVLTVEDPIEFVHAPIKARITQREVGKHVPDFPSAMRAAGREDADVILVGELRNAETMALALRLASFGVLVFGTVHTNGAHSTIDRFVNAFPADEQPMIRGLLGDSLIAVIAQELIPTADGVGRCAAQEILLGSTALSAMIREGKTHQVPNLMQGGRGMGMQTMDMALASLVKRGKITSREALHRARDRDALTRAMEER
ncbi:MAG: PilT/PilU family type 4a pilus ATPase [Polyangiaceae bacterium]